MKTKTKIIALVEIAIVLCSVFLVAIPAIAAQDQNQAMQKVSASEVTTASEDDYVLGIYGNANEDDTIDMRDLTYVKLMFFGKKPETELADAKYDGKINPLDFIQIKLIIVGKEKELTIVDSADRTVTVKKPVERMVVFEVAHPEAIQAIKATGKVAGVGKYTKKYPLLLPEFSKDKYPSVGSMYSPDIEKILELRTDVVILYAGSWADKYQEKFENVGLTVLRFNCYKPGDIYADEIRKLGYILDKRKEAEELIDFHQGWMNTIKDRVEKLSEMEKPRVYFEALPYGYKAKGKGTGYHHRIELAGGNNIFGDLEGSVDVDPEEVIVRDPEIIIGDATHIDIGGYDVNAKDITELKKVRDEIMNRPELQKVTALKDGKVYIITHATVCGELISISYHAKWFHPELFKVLDPKAIHQEYLTKFLGLDIDLDEKGVFVYPEPS